MLTEVNHINIYIYPSLGDFFPMQVTTECCVEVSVLNSGLSFVIWFIYSCIYVSVPISQFIPPSTFPTWCSYMSSLCLCLYSCLAKRFISIIFLESTYIWT